MSAEEQTNWVCLHPQLLTKSMLICHLERRCMNIKHMNTMSKEKLVDIFLRIALPLPQRKYRQNRRGKMLTKRRAERENRKAKKEDKQSSVSYGFGEHSRTQSRVSSGGGDRLKPPPDAVNYERKKIRLSSGSSSSSSVKSSDLDHIKIKRRREEDKNGMVKRPDKQEVNGELVTKESRSEKDHKSSSKSRIILKRSHSASTKHDAVAAEPEGKKEKKQITWP